MTQPTAKHLVFVYGNLKRGQRSDWSLCGETFKGRVRTEPKYRLFDAGVYPLLVAAEKGAGRSRASSTRWTTSRLSGWIFMRACRGCTGGPR
jgi:hypothetical protein